MAYNKLLKSEKKYRQTLLDCYYDTTNIYELKRELVNYFRKLNRLLGKIEKD